MNFMLQSEVTKAATASGTTFTFGPAGLRSLKTLQTLIFTLNVVSAERDTSNETYDIYVTTSDGVTSWDVAHFPQVASTGAKQFVARVNLNLLPQNVTTAAPGIAANDSGTLATVTGGTNAIKSLAAGSVRHGPIGCCLNHELVVAGTVVTGIKYSLKVQGR